MSEAEQATEMCKLTTDQDQQQHQNQARSSQDCLIECRTNLSVENANKGHNDVDDDEETQNLNSNILEQNNAAKTTCEESKTFASKKSYDPLIVLGVDLSPLHPRIQFYICAAGVFGFTIVYGYLQELLSVQIMGRKYALFLSLCQLAGYSFWSNVLMYVSRYRKEEIRRRTNEKNIGYFIVDQGAEIHFDNEAKTEIQSEAENMEKEEDDCSISSLTVNTSTTNGEKGQHTQVKSFQSQEKRDHHQQQYKLIPSPRSIDGGVRSRSFSGSFLSDTTSIVGTNDRYFNNDDYIKNTKNTENKYDHPHSPIHSNGPPFRIYLALSLIRALDIGLTNGAMKYLNYPAKTLIKSSRVAFTMFAGLLIGGKRYKMLDYLMVSMLVFGLTIFLHADHKSKAVFHPIGVFMLTLSLSCDGIFNNYSELIMKKHRISQDQFQAAIYSFACFIVLIGTIMKGELISGIQKMLLSHGSIAEIEESMTHKPYHLHREQSTYSRNTKLLVLFLFTFTGLFGSSCAGAITKRFGALQMSVTSTTRKACTLFLSLAAPGFQNKCTQEHVVGMIMFISALFVKNFQQSRKPRPSDTTINTKGFLS